MISLTIGHEEIGNDSKAGITLIKENHRNFKLKMSLTSQTRQSRLKEIVNFSRLIVSFKQSRNQKLTLN